MVLWVWKVCIYIRHSGRKSRPLGILIQISKKWYISLLITIHIDKKLVLGTTLDYLGLERKERSCSANRKVRETWPDLSHIVYVPTTRGWRWDCVNKSFFFFYPSTLLPLTAKTSRFITLFCRKPTVEAAIFLKVKQLFSERKKKKDIKLGPFLLGWQKDFFSWPYLLWVDHQIPWNEIPLEQELKPFRKEDIQLKTTLTWFFICQDKQDNVLDKIE